MPAPILHLTTVHHVGDLDPSSKRMDSYEGAGLSVCLHPSAWRRIARGFVAGRTHRMTNPNAAFLDAGSLDPKTRTSILAWSVERGLAVRATLWTLGWDDFDDEGEARRSYMIFTTKKEALEEAEEYEESNPEIARSVDHCSTPRLDELAMQSSQSLGNASVLDLVLPLWAHEVHGLSGVWWNEELDPLALSAPRGVIRSESMTDWKIEAIAFDPDDEDFENDEDLDEDDLEDADPDVRMTA